MSWMDFAGFVASVLVLVTFYMKDMVPLRLVALCSNAAFLVYGSGLHLLPILFLHGALIPINVFRLAVALRENGRLGRLILNPGVPEASGSEKAAQEGS